MENQTRSKDIVTFLTAGIITWLFFLIAFLCLTTAIMMFMELDIIGLVLLVFSVLFFIPNYFIFKYIIHYVSKEKPETNVLRTQHEILASLDRIIQIITLLVTLGFITAISTFVYIGMTFMENHNWNNVIQTLPVLFVIYLIFSFPSFYAIVEIGKMKQYLQNYSKIKDEIKSKMN